jgi:hypothetical protein
MMDDGARCSRPCYEARAAQCERTHELKAAAVAQWSSGWRAEGEKGGV